MRVTEIHSAGKPGIRTTIDGRITVVLPITILQRSAHKRILLPNRGSVPDTAQVKITPFQLALVRGHRWLSQLESGEAASLKDIARREGIDPSSVSRLLNLTTLAPEIADAIFDNTLLSAVTILDLAIDPALAWPHQVTALRFS